MITNVWEGQCVIGYNIVTSAENILCNIVIESGNNLLSFCVFDVSYSKSKYITLVN